MLVGPADAAGTPTQFPCTTCANEATTQRPSLVEQDSTELGRHGPPVAGSPADSRLRDTDACEGVACCRGNACDRRVRRRRCLPLARAERFECARSLREPAKSQYVVAYQ